MIKKSEVFIQFIQDNKTVYWWNQIRKIDKQSKSFTNQNNFCLEFIHKNFIIKKFLNKFNNVFFRKKAVFLANITWVSHFIQFIDKTQSLFESFYNFLTNELEILKKYLKKMQQC